MDSSSIAFKCTYNDGGKSIDSYGYKGVCTDAVIRYNIMQAKNLWCSSSDSYCMKYYRKRISRKELDDVFHLESTVCYESQFLDNWIMRAGLNLKGQRKGEGRTIRRTDVSNLAVLTTVLPGMPEVDRRIFAVFIIDEYYQGDMKEEGYVSSNSQYRLEFIPKETNELKFWDYYRCDNTDKCTWGSGLFRYLNNEQAVQILKKAVELKRGTNDEAISFQLLQKILHN